MSAPAGVFAKTLLPTRVGEPFDYAVPEGLEVAPGSFVEAPFGRRSEVGVVWSVSHESTVDAARIKPLARALPLPLLPEATRRFIDWVADYTMSPAGLVLKMALGAPEAFKPEKRKRQTVIAALGPLDQVRLPVLSGAQQNTGNTLINNINSGFSVAVLDGVTGSGKTEVYFHQLHAVLASGGQALVLLPEIALGTQWIRRFTDRFGVAPWVWHSGVTPARKREIWLKTLGGEPGLVMGARSALFLPFANLKAIVVDEEHEPSYKQEEGVLYHARDMAVVRAKLEGIPLTLVSATPSLETHVNAQSGRYRALHLGSRFGEAGMPAVSLIDMRREKLPAGRFLSDTLLKAVDGAVAQGGQAMLFLNRRGYAPLTLCRNCGHRLTCTQCSAWLVYHHARRQWRCHHCGITMPAVSACPECKEEDTLVACGPGVERVEQELHAARPHLQVAVMTSDTADNPATAEDLVSRMEEGAIQVLIGTQMIAKGYHFPNLRMVGVVDADLGLSGEDLRASERAFQLLHQVSGRAGREKERGQVLLQTYNAEHPVMKALAEGDRARFLELEMASRKAAAMPPFGRLAAVLVSGKDLEAVQQVCRQLARMAPHSEGVQVLGPAPAPISLLRGQHRMRFLLKTARNVAPQPLIASWLAGVKAPSSVTVRVDIDPQTFV